MLRGRRMICRHLVGMTKKRYVEGEEDSAKGGERTNEE